MKMIKQNANKIKVLKNGLRVIYIPRTNFSSTVLRFFVPAGSFSDGKNYGLAHLVEHIMTRRVERLIHDVNKTQWVGGHLITHFESGVNRRYTYFHFDVFWKDVHQVLDVFRSALKIKRFSSGDIKKEKDIIISEMRDASGYPFEKELEKLLKNAFGPAHPVLGTEKSLNTITGETVTDFFDDYYDLSNITLVVGGKITPAIQKIIERTLGDITSSISSHHRCQKTSRQVLENDLYITNRSADQAYCEVFYPVSLQNSKDVHRWEFISFVLYDYLRYVLREHRGLAYTTSVYLDDLWETPLLRIGFSVKSDDFSPSLNIWDKALSQFKTLFTLREYNTALSSYLKEWEMDADYPVTQVKKVGHYAMLFGADTSLEIIKDSPKKAIQRERVLDDVIALRKSIKLLYADVSGKLITHKDKKKILG